MRKQWSRLIELGYIVQDEEYENVFTFYRSPVVDGERPTSGKDEPKKSSKRKFDRLDATMAVAASNKSVKRLTKYAKTEEDYSKVDDLTEMIIDTEYPNLNKEQQTDTESAPENIVELPYMVKMGHVLEGNSDLYYRYHNAQSPEEYTAVCDDIRAAIIQKYGSA